MLGIRKACVITPSANTKDSHQI